MNQVIQNDSLLINYGYGEYIVYQQNNECKTSPALASYKKAFALLNAHRRQLGEWEEDSQYRFNALQNRIKAIDHGLDLTFLPRTLYDLLYLKQCIEEDITKGKASNRIDTNRQGKPNDSLWQNLSYNKLPEKNCDDEIEEHAYRFNAKLIEETGLTLCKTPAFSLQNIKNICSRVLLYYKSIHESNGPVKNIHSIAANAYHGPTCRFISDRRCIDGVPNRPLGIFSGEHQRLVRKAIKVECLPSSANDILLYRGSTIGNDQILKNGIPFSLSYGSSLFAFSSMILQALLFITCARVITMPLL